jgi:hypothetical protein
MQNLTLVIPLAGKIDKSFLMRGIEEPKCLIKNQSGISLLQSSLSSINFDRQVEIHFILNGKDKNLPLLEKEINKKFINSNVFKISSQTRGALESCFILTQNLLLEDSHLAIFLPDIKFLKKISLLRMTEMSADGWIPSFFSNSDKHSYLLTENNLVTKTEEKKVISNTASAGFYFFNRIKDFNLAAKNNIKNQQFFICPVYNFLIQKNKKVFYDYFDVAKCGTYEEVLENHINKHD